MLNVVLMIYFLTDLALKPGYYHRRSLVIDNMCTCASPQVSAGSIPFCMLLPSCRHLMQGSSPPNSDDL